MDSNAENRFETWAVVELMGHVRIAGKVTEEERFGVKLGRCDIPKGEGFVTQYFGGSSVYRVTPVSEEAARAVAARSQPEPVHRYELPPAPQASRSSSLDPDEDWAAGQNAAGPDDLDDDGDWSEDDDGHPDEDLGGDPGDLGWEDEPAVRPDGRPFDDDVDAAREGD